MLGFIIVVLCVAGFGIALSLFRTYRPKRVFVFEYQRGALFRKGVFEKIVEPGAHWTTILSSINLVDARLQTLLVAGQEVLTSDGLSVKLSVALEYRVEDAQRFLLMSSSPASSLHSYAQQAIREAVAGLTFDQILADRPGINTRLLERLGSMVTNLGFALTKAEIRDIILPGDLKRAYAQAITAQKEGVANLERARAETASLRSLANAARLMQDHPGLLQLRAVQAIEASKGNTITLGLADSRDKAPL